MRIGFNEGMRFGLLGPKVTFSIIREEDCRFYRFGLYVWFAFLLIYKFNGEYRASIQPLNLFKNIKTGREIKRMTGRNQ